MNDSKQKAAAKKILQVIAEEQLTAAEAGETLDAVRTCYSAVKITSEFSRSDEVEQLLTQVL